MGDFVGLEPNLLKRYNTVKASLQKSIVDAGRAADSVKLLAVSKTFSISVLEEAVACGMREFGENYVQEACEKIDFFKTKYPQLKLTWHLIGPLQSNKTRSVAERFDWVQSVDRLKIAQRLSDQRPAGLPPLNVLIEVNISNQESKSGVKAAEVAALAKSIKLLPNLRLRGLMCVPEPGQTEAEKFAPLKAMKILFDQMNEQGFEFDTLSMGMSADMAEAVKSGSTMVRIGTAIFGSRDYSKKGIPNG